MFLIAFIILDIVKHNVRHFTGVAEVALVTCLVMGALEILFYALLLVGSIITAVKVGREINKS
ncbi:MAG TPA: hypothetical protein VII94_01370 [Candidatus Saccharimonadales bacterium]